MRLYSILKELRDNSKYLPTNYFVTKFNVSKRTIQNDISYLMRISPRKGFLLHMKREQGYLLEITNETLFNDFLETLNETFYVSTNERPAHILSYLAIQEDYISMNKIADIFQVSKTVIKNDMHIVEKIAKVYHFEIERKQHYGIKINGLDQDFKKYLTEEYINGSFFIQTAVNDVTRDFKFVEQSFIGLLTQENVNVNYNELLNITDYLKIMVYSASIHSEQDENYTYQDITIHRLAKKVIDVLKGLYHVEFSNESIDGLITVLNKNLRKRLENIGFKCTNLEEVINDFLKKTDEMYETTFLQDEDFKKMLLIHVTLLIDRLHDKISYKNELANELSITNSVVFNIAIQFCDMLQELYDVKPTFDEVGFVAMHFAGHMEKEKQQKLQLYDRIGVVCSSGGGSAYMIKLQIESLFPKATVKTFSFLQQDALLDYCPDLVFTIMPLSFDIKAPIIYIKELLDDKDLQRIKQILQTDDYDPYTLINDKPMYQSFFSKDFFKIDEDDDYENLIYRMAIELEEQGYGKKGFADLVLERESYVSTIYMNGICIPHPLETDALKNMISVRILKKPFESHEKTVKLVFMVCLRKDQIEMYKVLTKKLYALMHEPKYIERILEVQSFEEMMAVLDELGGVLHE